VPWLHGWTGLADPRATLLNILDAIIEQVN
jgi:hypothetical protein